MSTDACRLRGQGPALVSGQSATYWSSSGKRTALGLSFAPADGSWLIFDFTLLAVVPYVGYCSVVAGSIHPARIFPAGFLAVSAMASTGSGSSRLGLRGYNGYPLLTKVPRVLRDLP